MVFDCDLKRVIFGRLSVSVMHFISFVNADLFLVITLFGSCDESSPEVIFLFRRLYTRIRGASLTVGLAYRRPAESEEHTHRERGNKISAMRRMEEGGNTTQQDTKGDAFVASKENSISGYESDLINLVLRFSNCSEPNLMFRTVKPSPTKATH